MNQSSEFSVAHITFSAQGGPGNVARILNEAALQAGLNSSIFSLTETSLREDWQSLPGRSILASMDEWILRSREHNSHISFFRDFFPRNVNSIEGFENFILGWTNGLLGDKDLRTIARSRVAVRLPDENKYTGVCHHALNCKKYSNGCGKCPALRPPFKSLAALNLTRKSAMLQKIERKFFACPSEWSKMRFMDSSIYREGDKVAVVRNPVHPSFFKFGKIEKSPTKTVLFVASQVESPDKGFLSVGDDLDRLSRNGQIKAIAIGNASHAIKSRFPNVKFLGRKSQEEIARVMASSWVTIVPSVNETAGNVVSESIACGTPVVTTGAGGSAELLSEVNGDWIQSKRGQLIERAVSVDNNDLEKFRIDSSPLAQQLTPQAVLGKYVNKLQSL